MFDEIQIGDRRLVGQQEAKERLMRTLRSGRTSHSYLFSGPAGSGKTALALAFAELLNGVDNLTDLKGRATSRKKSWFRHPDVHLFIPLPAAVAKSASSRSREMKNRLELLEKDPYEVVDFKMRPALDKEVSSKSVRAFYPIDFFNEEIRTKSFVKPNEGRYTVVIITGIDTMRKEAANAFLKLLEEPPENVIFLLTSEGTDRLLPTILSRCQLIRLSPLSEDELAEALIRFDGFSEKEASLLSRISGGNYSMARHFDIKLLRESRDDLIKFLRMAYVQDAAGITKLSQQWQSDLNLENQFALCSTLELLLRDLLIFRETGEEKLISNVDQLEVIRKFCESLADARLEEMIDHVRQLKGLLHQNVQFKLIFTVLALRFTFLMRGNDPVIPDNKPWKHLPALTYDPTAP